MRKQKNAFTLVELIVVITILAILGTVAFINLQGYSTSARDSKRLSDINNIQKKIGIEMAKGTSLSSLITLIKENSGLTIDNNTATSIQGTANFQLLKEDGTKFKDPITNGDYVLSYSVGGSGTGAYKFTQISTINEENNTAVVNGNYYKMQNGDSESIIKNNEDNFVVDGGINLPYEAIAGSGNSGNLVENTLFDKLITYLEGPGTEIYTDTLIKSLIGINGKLYFFDTENGLNSIDSNSTVEHISDYMNNKPFIFNNKLYYVWFMYGEVLTLSYTDGNITTDIQMEVDDAGDNPKNIIFNNKLYFWGNNSNNNSDGWELYTIDTNNNITYIDINPTGDGKLSSGSTFGIFNNKLYFWANDGSDTKKLFTLDSSNNLTDLGISSIDSIWSGDNSPFVNYNGRLYFMDTSADNGKELFYIDSLNNVGFYDINVGTASSWPGNFNIFNNRLYFTADNTTIGNELFYIDSLNNLGFYDINPGVDGSWISGINNFNNKMYFVGAIGTNQFNFNIDNTNNFTSNNDQNNFSSILGIFGNKLFFEGNLNNNRLNYIDSLGNTQNTPPLNIPMY